MASEQEKAATLTKPLPSDRLSSLDAFRGFTIIGMLFVNNPGHPHAYPRQMFHAGWGEVVTFCDMIFPWFLFIVGVALPFSVAAFRRRNPDAGLGTVAMRAGKRAAILIFLGIIIISTVQKRLEIRMDVLQLIGTSFFVAALLYEAPKRVRMAAAAGLLIFHWILLRFVPIPGGDGWAFEANNNIIWWINNQLRPYHLAGILSTVPCAALILIGTWFGDALRASGPNERMKMVKTMIIGGVVLCVAGYLWSYTLPMNKLVWTPPYMLWAAGLGSLLLAVFYFLMDIKGWKAWAFPCMVYGMNAIAAYFISIIVRLNTVQAWYTTYEGEQITLWRRMLIFWSDLAGETLGSWLFTTAYVTFWFFVMWWMYRKKIFWRV